MKKIRTVIIIFYIVVIFIIIYPSTTTVPIKLYDRNLKSQDGEARSITFVLKGKTKAKDSGAEIDITYTCEELY